MGIDLRSYSDRLPAGLIFKKSKEKILQQIERAAADWAKKMALGPLFRTRRANTSLLEVELIPLADPLVIDVGGDRLTASCRTSNAGPGFHAAVIGLLDHLETDLKIQWIWKSSTGEPLDETGYALHRNFHSLQMSMSEFLTALCRVYQNASDDLSLSLCLPLELAGCRNGILTPKGPQSVEWLRNCPDSIGRNPDNAAKPFFVWWDRHISAATWQSILEALLWQRALWHPTSEPEHELIASQIEYAAAKAVAPDSDLPAPVAQALMEWRNFQDGENWSETPPSSEGMGYRRGLVTFYFDDWAIKLPGYLRATREQTAFEHSALWLGFSMFNVTSESGDTVDFRWPSSFEGPLQMSKSGLHYRQSVINEDESGSRALGTIFMRPNGATAKVLLLTLSSHLDWPFDQLASWLATAHISGDMRADKQHLN